MGTGPQASSNHSRPASSVTRPGRKPGVRPSSSAPRTLPRRSAERKRTRSPIASSSAAAATVASADSATEGRPRMTTIGPPALGLSAFGPSLARRSSAAASICGSPVTAPPIAFASLWAAVACSPGVMRMVASQYRLSPWSRAEMSTSGTPRSSAARFTRSESTGSSSFRSGPSSTMPEACSRSPMVAPGRPSTTSAGSPSPS